MAWEPPETRPSDANRFLEVGNVPMAKELSPHGPGQTREPPGTVRRPLSRPQDARGQGGAREQGGLRVPSLDALSSALEQVPLVDECS